MGAKLIDGKAIAAAVRSDVAVEVAELMEQGVRPGLGVVLVGEDPASQVYVRMKEKACAEAGILSRDVRPAADISQEELLAIVDELNANPEIHGILVQLPLPDHLDERTVTERILPEKDVDGFHPTNVGRVSGGDLTAFRPATPAGVQELLRRIDVDPSGKHVVIVGRSNIVGMPMGEYSAPETAGGQRDGHRCAQPDPRPGRGDSRCGDLDRGRRSAGNGEGGHGPRGRSGD